MKSLVPQSGSCLHAGAVCQQGLSCVGKSSDKRCVALMTEGKQCGQDPFWICHSDLNCVSGTCQRAPVPQGGSCLDSKLTCSSGLACAGTDSDKRCVRPMTLNGDCGQDPFWICESTLKCIEGKCSKPVIPAGQSCIASGSICADGLVCTGSETDKRCVKPMPLDGECGQDPFWICQDGLNCMNGTCKKPVVPEGHSCLSSGSVCADGLVCTGSDTDKRCVKPMILGGSCGQDPFWVCQKGLECIDSKCRTPVIPEGQSCLSMGSVCGTGLICTGSDTDKRCVKPMPLNSACGQDPFWVCQADLECVDGKCRQPVIPLGQSCLASGSVCADSLVCAGSDTDKRCVKPMPHDGACGQDPFWICQDGLDCVDGKCREPFIQEGKSCLEVGSVCVSGTICAGSETDKRCVKPMQLGGACGQDPFWVCQDGLECAEGKCRKPEVEEGQSCLAAGSVCTSSLICAGSENDKRCVKPMPLGGACGQDPFWVCEPHLKCVEGKCRVPEIQEGESCLASGSVCAPGLKCAGSESNEICVQPMGPNSACGQDPFWVCQDGLDCIEGKCQTPKLHEGESCLATGSVCASDLKCAGTDADMRCVKPMPLGGACGQDPFWVCQDGLQCAEGKCQKPVIPEGQSCLATGSVCASDLKCAGSDSEKRCVKPMGPNGACGQDPFWVCQDGLQCTEGKCNQPKIPDGQSCLAVGSVCADDLICAGSESDRRCVQPMQIDGACGQDPFWICEVGLACISGRCRKTITEGHSCIVEGSVCGTGLVCTGSDSDKRCVKPMQLNGRCGQDPFWVCDASLRCLDGMCQQ